jgi:DNA repair protein RadC
MYSEIKKPTGKVGSELDEKIVVNHTKQYKDMKMYELEVRYKNLASEREKVKLCDSQVLREYIKSMYADKAMDWREYAFVICLNNSMQVIGHYELSHGGITGTIVDPRVVFGVALGCQACSIIVVHNHPSGTFKMSNADIAISERLETAGRALDVRLTDFVICTEQGIYSQTMDNTYYYEV